jgi:hypothetical protein
MTMTAISGYALGSANIPRSPVALVEFDKLKETVLFTDEDIRWLRQSAEVLRDQTEAILDVWYGFVGSKPYLLQAFVDPATGKPDEVYLAAVRKRFGQWILDTAAANYDQAWLDYQHEIGRRHYRTGKNRTDGAKGSDIVPLRYLIALHYPVTATLKPFLATKGHPAVEVDKMHEAWVKIVLLQVILWSEPYVAREDF